MIRLSSIKLFRQLLLLRRLSILPRKVILLLDASIAVFSMVIAFLFLTGAGDLENIIFGSLLFGVLAGTIMFMTGSYSGVVRHTAYVDTLVLFKTMAITLLVTVVFRAAVVGVGIEAIFAVPNIHVSLLAA